MKKFKKVLIALDQSEQSNNIMNYGKTISRLSNPVKTRAIASYTYPAK